MSSGENNINEVEDTISFVEVLQQEEELEENANAVLGASDDKNCSYIAGYVYRQALYACATCTSEGSAAGVCLACGMTCHKDHELYELYTKRNFRCDCGNSLFAGNKCKLQADKEVINTENKYGQNFFGKYCVCSRPYPDPDDTEEDMMIQCIICEDWFHARHLETPIPEDSDYEEMICTNCVKRCSFLNYYAAFSKVDFVDNGNSCDTSLVTVPNDEASSLHKLENFVNNGDIVSSDLISVNHKSDAVETVAEQNDGNDGGPSSQTSEDINVTSLEETSSTSCAVNCRLPQQCHKLENTQALFMPAKWRTLLCRCEQCLKMYKDLEVSFLLDENDTISAYESKGSLSATSSVDSGMNALAGLHRIQQVELINGYNEMKSELIDYLKKFADNKKVVREEDIREFFGQMEAKKRQKSGPGMQYFCK